MKLTYNSVYDIAPSAGRRNMETTVQQTLTKLQEAYTANDKHEFLNVCETNMRINELPHRYTLQVVNTHIPVRANEMLQTLKEVIENPTYSEKLEELIQWCEVSDTAKIETGIYDYNEWKERVDDLYRSCYPQVLRALVWKNASIIITELNQKIEQAQNLENMKMLRSKLQAATRKCDIEQLMRCSNLFQYEGCTEGLYVYGADMIINVSNCDIAKYLGLDFEKMRYTIEDIYAENEFEIDAHFLFEAREDIINNLTYHIEYIEDYL